MIASRSPYGISRFDNTNIVDTGWGGATIHDLWVVSPTEAYAVGGGDLWLWNGATWTVATPTLASGYSLRSIWRESVDSNGDGFANLYLGGLKETWLYCGLGCPSAFTFELIALRRDGTTWVSLGIAGDVGIISSLPSMSGSSSGATLSGPIATGDTLWIHLAAPPPLMPVSKAYSYTTGDSLWRPKASLGLLNPPAWSDDAQLHGTCNNATTAFEGAYHFNDTMLVLTCSPLPSPANSVWGTGPCELFAVGDGGAIMRRN